MSWEEKLLEYYPEKVINKQWTREIIRRQLPRFVTEYLLAKYSDRGKDETIRLVNDMIQKYYPEPRHAERVLFDLAEEGSMRLLGFYAGRFDEKLNMPLVRTTLFGKREMRIIRSLLTKFPVLLEGGAWGIAEIIYDSDFEINGRKIPLLITNFAPFQVARIDMEDYKGQSQDFTSDEWLSVLISTIGLNADAYTQREKLYVLSRFISLVEPNVNLIELGPRGTGKTYGLRNISPYGFVLSGGRTTAAQLFLDLRTREVGVIARKDTVVFDEIASAKFDQGRDDVLGILKDYMASGVFSRGSVEMPSECGILMVGNTDHGARELAEEDEEYLEQLADDVLPGMGAPEVDEDRGTLGDRYLFQALPDALWDTALFDRIHGFIPGWRIQKLQEGSFSKSPGFISDYFAEVLHRLRRDDYAYQIRSMVRLKADGGSLTARDEEAVIRLVNGFIKLLHPHGEFTSEELYRLVGVACELRTMVAQQQHYIEELQGGRSREFPIKQIGYETVGV